MIYKLAGLLFCDSYLTCYLSDCRNPFPIFRFLWFWIPL